jgi:hypothetical protein
VTLYDELRDMATQLLASTELIPDAHERACITAWLQIADSYFDPTASWIPFPTLDEWLASVTPPMIDEDVSETQAQRRRDERVVAYVRRQLARGMGAQSVIRESCA